MLAWIYLTIAIFSEIIGTMALKASDGFSNISASILCIVSYCAAFYLLSLVVKSIPVGIAYAIWAGAGIVLVTVASALWYKQIPDASAIAGMLLIVAGVVVINLFSNTLNH